MDNRITKLFLNISKVTFLQIKNIVHRNVRLGSAGVKREKNISFLWDKIYGKDIYLVFCKRLFEFRKVRITHKCQTPSKYTGENINTPE